MQNATPTQCLSARMPSPPDVSDCSTNISTWIIVPWLARLRSNETNLIRLKREQAGVGLLHHGCHFEQAPRECPKPHQRRFNNRLEEVLFVAQQGDSDVDIRRS